MDEDVYNRIIENIFYEAYLVTMNITHEAMMNGQFHIPYCNISIIMLSSTSSRRDVERINWLPNLLGSL